MSLKVLLGPIRSPQGSPKKPTLEQNFVELTSSFLSKSFVFKVPKRTEVKRNFQQNINGKGINRKKYFYRAELLNLEKIIF